MGTSKYVIIARLTRDILENDRVQIENFRTVTDPSFPRAVSLLAPRLFSLFFCDFALQEMPLYRSFAPCPPTSADRPPQQITGEAAS